MMERVELSGIAVSEGTAVARVFWRREPADRSDAAASATLSPDAEADIFEAHSLIATDPSLIDDAEARVRAGLAAFDAVMAAARAVSDELAAVDDPYLQARSSDILEAAERIVAILSGAPLAGFAEVDAAAGRIVFARELTAAEMSTLAGRAAGVVLAQGGANSHAALIARAAGLPAAFGVGALPDAGGDDVALIDGGRGLVVVNPSPDDAAGAQREQRRLARARDLADERRMEPAFTRDGVRIMVAGNASGAAEAAAAFDAGADEIGLIRTEFLFADEPAELDQIGSYEAILKAAGDRRVIFRAFDFGADKPPAWVTLPHEDNPFLGRRGGGTRTVGDVPDDRRRRRAARNAHYGGRRRGKLEGAGPGAGVDGPNRNHDRDAGGGVYGGCSCPGGGLFQHRIQRFDPIRHGVRSRRQRRFASVQFLAACSHSGDCRRCEGGARRGRAGCNLRGSGRRPGVDRVVDRIGSGRAEHGGARDRAHQGSCARRELCALPRACRPRSGRGRRSGRARHPGG